VRHDISDGTPFILKKCIFQVLCIDTFLPECYKYFRCGIAEYKLQTLQFFDKAYGLIDNNLLLLSFLNKLQRKLISHIQVSVFTVATAYSFCVCSAGSG